jgi:hypothetical protein
MLKPITIDVATSAAGIPTEGMPANTTFVRFGTGALQINMDELAFDISLGSRGTVIGTNATAGVNAISLNENMGRVSMGKMAIYLSPWSYVDIFSADAQTAGNTSGVCFAVNVTIDRFTLGYITWGDKDGLAVGNVETNATWMGTGGSAGYVGLDQFMVNGPIAITGTVAININTSSAGIYAQLPGYVDYLATTQSCNISDKMAFLVSLSSAWQNVASNNAIAQTTYTTYLGMIGSNSTQFPYANFISGGVLLAMQKDAISSWSAGMYQAATVYTTTPVTVVHIAFPTDFIVNVMGSITGDVRLGNTYNFQTNLTGPTTNALSLGDIYISGFKMTVKTGSWVDIWAH